MNGFGQIPKAVICRFHELSKTEIVVICYLYGVRNLTTGQCNPSKAAIGRAIGIARPHVSRAISGLINLGWLDEVNGDFVIREDGEKRTKTVTPKRTKSAPLSVPISPPERTKTVTKAYQNGNAHIKDLKDKNIQEENTKEEPSSDGADHALLMKHHHDRLGVITDGGSQGKAVKDLLKNFTVTDCLRYYDYQVLQLESNGGWRDAVSWRTVLPKIAEWIAAGKPKEPVERKNGSSNNNRNAAKTGVTPVKEFGYGERIT